MSSLLAPHRAWLVGAGAAGRITRRSILFQELRAQPRLRGGYDTVRDAVRPLRLEAAAAERSRSAASRPSRASRRRSTGARCGCRLATGPGRSACLRDDAGLLAARLGGRLRDTSVWRRCSRRTSTPSSTSAGAPREILYDRMRTVMMGGTSAEGQNALESDVRGLRPALGLRAAAVPAVPGADQGQGRVRA